ncbi:MULTISPECIES: hypothetical protein [unclassified Methylobacter]|uniref:hypothetical protein n=1 Tax=unclassified Methylobacter TaxID=2635283 RepID=UPI0018947D5A|nr:MULTISPECIES: hypothetical protein [unclassified Methylobacter]MBF6650975.1 hypothetical protein [Methylobacter sp. BlB1]WAK04510.1 hypothetical protein LZ558_21245 [Methylobacter sp. YRD-M1]WAK04569.1 hypothetical protein LZ558_22520 [Methylobacter sp. YRD-M1]
MLTTLRSPRHRPCLHVLLCALLVSWLAMLVSATCAMPSPWILSSAGAMPAGCSESEHVASQPIGHITMPDQDCSLQPCLDSPPNPAFEFKMDNPQMPIFALCMIGLVGFLLPYAPRQPRIARATAPPIGRRILLIYRFCTLLN